MLKAVGLHNIQEGREKLRDGNRSRMFKKQVQIKRKLLKLRDKRMS